MTTDSGTFWIIALERPDDREKHGGEDRRAWSTMLDQSQRVQPPGASLPGTSRTVEFAGIRRNMTRDGLPGRRASGSKRYIRGWRRLPGRISRTASISPFTGRPIQLFHWQNRYNPSGYAAYLDAGDFQIVSTSPEMFITIRDRRDSARNRSKGTRPRLERSRIRMPARLNEQQFQRAADQRERTGGTEHDHRPGA